MSTTIEGTCTSVALAKRQHFPGVIVRSECPRCGHEWRADMAHTYASYPVVGEPHDAGGYCGECGHEWPVMLVARLSLEVAP